MILAMDIGTTFLKVAVIDFEGTVCFFEKSAIDVDYSRNDILLNDPDSNYSDSLQVKKWSWYPFHDFIDVSYKQNDLLLKSNGV